MRFTVLFMAKILVSVMLGFAVGVGAYTFVFARGASYLTDDPAACSNCHIMSEHYSGWLKSSHRNVAVCNDCHTPSNFLSKYATKASNGFWHSVAFTTGNFPEPLRIKPHNYEVAEQACRRCHQDMVEAITGNPQETACIRCHDEVGHRR